MTIDSEKYRNELKYIISDSEMVILQKRIENLCCLDENTINGTYNISSVYFDDYGNDYYYANENGEDPRDKFRIRIYNHSDNVINLECKRKERGKTKKESCPLTKEQAEQILNGNISVIDLNNKVLNKLILLMRTKLLKPVTIVEYDRIPYINKNGNVRITFDMNLSSNCKVSDFFDGNKNKRPVMPKGYLLLEVKFNEYLPDEIYRALQINVLQQTAFSKYYLCRKYSLKGSKI